MGGTSGYTIEQNWPRYSEEEHAIWRFLFERQQCLLVGRACREYLDGLRGLGVAPTGQARGLKAHGGIPDFRRLSDILDRATGWRIVAVPGLVPDDLFFALLARRRFPSTCFIRRRDQLDYLQEPDVFHDIYGHVPLLMNPVFADYMQAYGEGGLKALRLGHLRATGAALLVHGRVRADRDAAGAAHLRLGHPLLGGRIGLLPRRPAAASAALRSAPRHADAIPHRPLSGDLLRDRRFRSAVRRDPARFRADLSRDRAAAGYRGRRDAARRRTGRAEVRTARAAASANRAGKKKGRTLARPEFREETPRRRTAEPPEVIHTAPHNLRIGRPEVNPSSKYRWQPWEFRIARADRRGRVVCGCTNSRPLATFRRKVIRRDDTAAAARPDVAPCSSMSTAPCWRSRRGRSSSRCPPGLPDAPRTLGGASAAARWRCQRPAARRSRSPVRGRGEAPPPACTAPSAGAPTAAWSTSGDDAGRPAAAAALDRLRPVLSDLARRMPGVWLEDKGRTLALHYRAAPENAAEISVWPIDRVLREHGATAAADRRQDGGRTAAAPSRQGRRDRRVHGRAAVSRPAAGVSSATIRPTRTALPRSTGAAASRSGSAAGTDNRGDATPCPSVCSGAGLAARQALVDPVPEYGAERRRRATVPTRWSGTLRRWAGGGDRYRDNSSSRLAERSRRQRRRSRAVRAAAAPTGGWSSSPTGSGRSPPARRARAGWRWRCAPRSRTRRTVVRLSGTFRAAERDAEDRALPATSPPRRST